MPFFCIFGIGIEWLGRHHIEVCYAYASQDNFREFLLGVTLAREQANALQIQAKGKIGSSTVILITRRS